MIRSKGNTKSNKNKPKIRHGSLTAEAMVVQPTPSSIGVPSKSRDADSRDKESLNGRVNGRGNGNGGRRFMRRNSFVKKPTTPPPEPKAFVFNNGDRNHDKKPSLDQSSSTVTILPPEDLSSRTIKTMNSDPNPSRNGNGGRRFMRRNSFVKRPATPPPPFDLKASALEEQVPTAVCPYHISQEDGISPVATAESGQLSTSGQSLFPLLETNNTNQDDAQSVASSYSLKSMAMSYTRPASRRTTKTVAKFSLEQLENSTKSNVLQSEDADKHRPRHKVGCTEHECHGAMMEKKGFGSVSNADVVPQQEKLNEAVTFLKQYYREHGVKEAGDTIHKRIDDVTDEIMTFGTYSHTFDELQYGCRLAWRNSGRCIMRKVSFSLELRDCRSVMNAEKCFEEIVSHLRYANNSGAIKPVISVFPPKKDGKSAPVRIWNPQLIGYAAYKLPDGTIMGDPARLSFTTLCVKYGWAPPSTKSSFDILPLLISDESTGHETPKVFELPHDTVLEVEIHHPEHEHFSQLNLRWYALPAISNMGVDIGGVIYQTCPFNGWYQITEIARDLLDVQRYNLAKAVAVVCDIPQTKLTVWKDDVQLQMNKAILHSFAVKSVSTVDHHTSSEQFLEFYASEIQKRKRCPADWVWLVPPAGGSMTGVFHQEMLNFIVKPQYRLLSPLWDEHNMTIPDPITIEDDAIDKRNTNIAFDRNRSHYDNIVVFFGSETGTSLKFATMIVTAIDDECCSGPFALDKLPYMLDMNSKRHFVKPGDDRTLILVFTSTFGKGNPPSNAKEFLSRMQNRKKRSSYHDFAVFGLGNSAYVQSFAAFGHEVYSALKNAGCHPITTLKIADELQNQNESFELFKQLLLDKIHGLLNGSSDAKNTTELEELESRLQCRDSTCIDASEKDLLYLKFIGVAKANSMSAKNKLHERVRDTLQDSWSHRSHQLGRSLDLFSFSLPKSSFGSLDKVLPGDHVAIYPTNTESTTDYICRMIDIEEYTIEQIKQILLQQVDLTKPLSMNGVHSFLRCTKNNEARFVMELLVNDVKIPSIEVLISKVPPGSVMVSWILEHAPRMEPRFYSIASISQKNMTITILQSIFTHEETGKTGTTSRWLRYLQPGDKLRAKFSNSEFHLPKEKSCPILLIATGSGIAPFRAFWTNKVKNPMVLFYGTKSASEFPFVSEIKQLRSKGVMQTFIAYSDEPGKKKVYVQDLMVKQSDLILDHFYKKESRIYVCGNPTMESNVREKLTLILARGNALYPGVSISKAAERLAFHKHTKRYITEVYGTQKLSNEAMEMIWQTSLQKIVQISSSLERIRLPRPRHNIFFTPKENELEEPYQTLEVATPLSNSYHSLSSKVVKEFDLEELCPEATSWENHESKLMSRASFL